MANLRLAFVDWTFLNDENTEAIGTLGGHDVRLTGQRPVATDRAPLGTAVLDGTFTGFHTAFFSPPLPTSDLIEIVGLRGGSSFRVEFDAEVKDPVFHLGSLASTLEFLDLPVGTEVTQLSGDAAKFKVDGNSVTGKVFQPPPESTEPTDSDGTVRLNGLFRSIAFTLTPGFDGHDGVHLQIGGMVEAGSDMAEIRIDSSGLTFTKFSVSGHSPDVVDGASAPVLSLAPGVYGIEQVPGRPTSFEFQVTQEGFVEYDPAHDAFLGGRGTSMLILRGFPVTIDGRALSHDLEAFLQGSAARFSRSTAHELALLPAEGYAFVPGPRVVVPLFDVGVDGAVRLAETVAQCASVGVSPNGSPHVTIHGFTVTIDGRALSHDLEPFLNGNDKRLPRTNVNQLVLIPAQGYGFVPGPRVIVPAFDLNPDGTITLTSSTAQCATTSTTPNGTPLVTIHGFTVTIDGRALSHDLLPFLNGNDAVLSRATVHELVLIPAEGYGLVLSRGFADFRFTVTPDGQVSLHPDHVGFAEVSGLTLTLRGYKVTIDATALSHDLNPELLGWSAGPLSRTAVHELTLLPGQSYMFILARGMADFHFAVTTDGRIGLGAEYAGFAEAVERTLVLRGFKVTIDATALSHDLNPELLGWSAGPLSRTAVHELTLLPGQSYMFILARGMAD
ncbi:hypothetical protein, partial [Streptomyces sp. NPDC048560]|uniref:hypothetical protein n=1 Tax=Streptomyces sp. NPDC048560 TaxID=3155488 RepID=UPI003445C31F